LHVIIFDAMRLSEKSGQAEIDALPNECPYCLRTINPSVIDVINPVNYDGLEDQSIQVILLCPSFSCHKVFVGYYENFGHAANFVKTSQGALKRLSFNEAVDEISPDFSIIYNQAFAAEQQELLEICGVGYRKALEFLIKDYAIDKDPSVRETIEKKMLMACINDYVNDNRIKSVAKRAVWLGNDETHYIRKWAGKNLDDLKKLIDLTVHWIEMEKLTKSFEEDMPG